MKFIDEMIPSDDGNVNPFPELDWDLISEKANQLSNNLKPKTKRKLPTIESALDKVTERVRMSGDLPEKFPVKTDTVSIETGQGYLARSLETTRNRLSRYYEISNRLVQPMHTG